MSRIITSRFLYRRREFIAGLGSAAALPMAARAQAERVRHVGVLMSVGKDDPIGVAEVAVFRRRLAELGWVEGRNIGIEVRWPDGNIESAERLAKELIGLNPDVLLSRSTPLTAALKKETSAIPIVFVNVAEPVEQGFVQSLARPGGNITGFTNFEAAIGGKMLQLLKEIDPRIVRVAVIYNPQTAPFAGSYVRSIELAGAVLGVEVIKMSVQSDANIETGIAAFAREPGGGLIQIPDSFTGQRRELIFASAARNRLPAVYTNIFDRPFRGLMAYSTDTRDLMHRAADYVDRIFKGATPAELPVQMPTRFNVVINRKVATALGLAISPQLSVLADEVIE